MNWKCWNFFFLCCEIEKKKTRINWKRKSLEDVVYDYLFSYGHPYFCHSNVNRVACKYIHSMARIDSFSLSISLSLINVWKVLSLQYERLQRRQHRLLSQRRSIQTLRKQSITNNVSNKFLIELFFCTDATSHSQSVWILHKIYCVYSQFWLCILFSFFF